MKQNRLILISFFVIFMFTNLYGQISDSLIFKITFKDHQVHYLRSPKSVRIDSIYHQIQSSYLSSSSIAFVDSIELNNTGQWKTIYVSESKQIVDKSRIYVNPENFNWTHFLAQSAGAYLISGSLAILSGLTVHNANSDDKGITSAVTFFLVFNLTSPFSVYFIGEKLNGDNQVAGRFSNTFMAGGLVASISFGSLTPIGAAWGYQSSKYKKAQLQNEGAK